MTEQRDIAINVPVLARVEGEGALSLTIREGRIEELTLRIFEPPRFFEKFLEGRAYHEVLDIVARICGICPVAYQMSAVAAIESAFEVNIDPWVRAMRRVFYCGEWIQSHSLHIHLLALPDFLGVESAIALARRQPELVRRGLRLQATGNALIRLFGGRSVHPVGARVGGFFRAPPTTAVATMREELAAALPEAKSLVRAVADLRFPQSTQQFTSVALVHPTDYPMAEGRITSSTGLDIAPSAFEQHFTESQVPYSTALQCHLQGEPYLVGPLARLNLNVTRLPSATAALLAELSISFPSTNPFHSIVARALEIHAALVEAQRLLADYEIPVSSFVATAPRAGIGFGATEAPRGLLWHRYEFDAEGLVRTARIVPPTSQNQARIEDDLRQSLSRFGLDQPADALRHHAETAIRNYDPCISCATHFLRLTVQRT